MVIPVSGQPMWIDSQQLVFLDGAGLAVCSLALARLIPGKMRMEKREK